MKKNASSKYAFGIDLGGTKIAVALVNLKGKVIEKIQWPILRPNPDKQPEPDVVVSQIADMVRTLIGSQGKKILGIGFISTGPLNVITKRLIYPTHFPEWKIVPICKLLEKKLAKFSINTSVEFQNDAMAAAMAESWVGGAKNVESFAVITIGTGIGTGLFLNGRPAQSNGMGSEWGNGIYNEQSFEEIASGSGILNKAKRLGFRGNSVEELVSGINNGNNSYRIVFNEAAKALASLSFNLTIGFNLEKILFSGGLIQAQDLFFDELKKQYRKLINTFGGGFGASLEIAKLKNDAGVVGAASLVFNKKGK